MRFLALFSLLFVVAILACNTSKDTVGNKKKLSKADVEKVIRNHHHNFTFFHGKAKAEAGENGNGMGFTAQIRMKRNEYLWINFSKLGFEVARALIRPDSAFIVDRFNKEYYKESLPEYLAEYQIPFNFQELQGMFIGNLPIPSAKNGVIEANSDSYTASYKEINGTYFYTLDPLLGLIKTSEFVDRTRRTVLSKLDDYQEIKNTGVVPFFIDHKIMYGQNEVDLTIKYSDMVFGEEKSIPFEIPAHYAKAQ